MGRSHPVFCFGIRAEPALLSQPSDSSYHWSGGRKCAWTPLAYANSPVFARSDVERVCASPAANSRAAGGHWNSELFDWSVKSNMTTLPQRFLSRGWFVAFACLALHSIEAHGDDWPQFRGPNRDAVWAETGILKSFPRSGLSVRWRYPVDRGFSSPVVAAGRVYVTDAQLQDPRVRERVHCVEEGTGKLVWTRSWETDHPDWIFLKIQERGPGATPIMQDGKLYVLGIFGVLVCLDAAGGAECWRKNLRRDYQLKDMPTDASPLIEGDLLIVFVGGTPGACVIAFDKNSGREVWRALEESLTHSSPIVVDAGGTRQLIVWTHESVTSLDPMTGKTRWAERLPTSADAAVATPVFHKEHLLIGGLMLKFDGEKPSVLWPETRAISRRILSNTSSALFRSEQVFSARSTGELVCLEAGSGRQLWQTNGLTNAKNGASIHLTAHGEEIFLFTDHGELIQAQLSANGYKEISRTALVQPTSPFMGSIVAWAAPAFANRHVYARTDQELVAVSLAAKP